MALVMVEETVSELSENLLSSNAKFKEVYDTPRMVLSPPNPSFALHA
jgi:hypothetical protein